MCFYGVLYCSARVFLSVLDATGISALAKTQEDRIRNVPRDAEDTAESSSGDLRESVSNRFHLQRLLVLLFASSFCFFLSGVQSLERDAVSGGGVEEEV